jgi:hypothetical protein
MTTRHARSNLAYAARAIELEREACCTLWSWTLIMYLACNCILALV